MKQSILKPILLLMALVPLVWLSSCEEDEGPDENPDTTSEFLPVLNDNFSYVVDGNDVNFTTIITGNVWVTTNDVDHSFTDGKVTVNLPNQGTYTFTCSSLGSGEILTSEAFQVEITQDDLEFLNVGYWEDLSGGANQTKTWRMDINSDAESVYFDGPMYYSGADGAPYWAWDVLASDLPVMVGETEMTGFFNWSPVYSEQTWLMPAKDYGTITFNGTTGEVSTTIFGTTNEGSFSFDTATLKMTLSGVVLPVDTGRVNEGQYLDEDLHNVRIFSLSDSAMQIGIKRTYEGFEDDGVTPVESKWTNVYNFVVVGYDYPEPEEFTFEEPVDTDFTSGDLEGTWKFSTSQPFDWVGWRGVGNQGSINDPAPLNAWADDAAMIATDWLGITQDQLNAAYAQEYTFAGDGSADINGTATTYSVDAGVITFADSVTFAIADHWYSVKVKDIKVIDVPGTDGIWIGNQNEAKNESQAFHLLKQ